MHIPEIEEGDPHRDAFGRLKRIKKEHENHDHFVRSYDGRLDLLRVQTVNPSALPCTPSLEWVRVPMKTKTTPLNRVLYWTWSSTQKSSRANRIFKEYPYLDVALKWIPSCTAMLLLFCFPQNIGGETRNNGFYDPVRERARLYSKAARNPCEDVPRNEGEEHIPLLNANPEPYLEYNRRGGEDTYWVIAARPPRPRLLCFLVKNDGWSEDPENSFEVRTGDNKAEYVFVSYTRREFSVETEKYPDYAPRDRKELLRFAVAATRAARVPAFWIDFYCVATDMANTSRISDNRAEDTNGIYEDVYRICDVVRAAHSMAVVAGPPSDRKHTLQHALEEDRQRWLELWASRLWVLPEILLAPGEHRVLIYIQAYGVEPENIVPVAVAKRNLAEWSCSDAGDIKQLIDHYEGSAQLSKLELVQLALDSLQRRTTMGRTNADLAYALKGLLRRRPQTVMGESGFEAFASLSLANDSQRLLERLICMLPPDPDADWSDMRDAWGMQLWDIEPTCQIAGIDNSKVLLDGAYGASIRWNHLETVAFIKRDTALRTVGKIAVRTSPLYFSLGVFLVATGREFRMRGPNPILIIGAILLASSLLAIFVSPYLLFKIYLGKFWSTQAWFFGIEGEVDDLGKIERSLFGFSEGRLTWSTNGSLLSRHHENAFHECEADPPKKDNIRDVVPRNPFHKFRTGTLNNEVHQVNSPPTADTPMQNGQLEPANPILQPNHTGPREQKVFTLIDTYSMTATRFYAYHPPTTVLICGQEGAKTSF
ncbi:hypothetical protein K469DRAFT_695699 [Zopfia rhizophila CBS 207.26]|uniref:Heterokaryon incompatibility domain-containing protein n=1 Tax=Zopfia rhizophila CBS 207.26 TaxID=1314779 RepID=A0A6A6DJP9_9PEZI|nr:hypothetical protein K469DRAFT_695699 [Zopfia rhizophila CBS 207.26]